jgi:hypothetical protein
VEEVIATTLIACNEATQAFERFTHIVAIGAGEGAQRSVTKGS